jgi:hypothetical protein
MTHVFRIKCKLLCFCVLKLNVNVYLTSSKYVKNFHRYPRTLLQQCLINFLKHHGSYRRCYEAVEILTVQTAERLVGSVR